MQQRTEFTTHSCRLVHEQQRPVHSQDSRQRRRIEKHHLLRGNWRVRTCPVALTAPIYADAVSEFDVSLKSDAQASARHFDER